MAEKVIETVRSAWWWLRQVSGDAAYENYLRSRRRRAWEKPHNCGEATLSREQFYVEQLDRRYRGASRCC